MAGGLLGREAPDVAERGEQLTPELWATIQASQQRALR